MPASEEERRAKKKSYNERYNARKKAERLNGSQSRPSNGSPAPSAQPDSLPPTVERASASSQGELQAMLSRAMTRQAEQGKTEQGKTEQKTPKPKRELRELPEDTQTRDKVLSSSRILARIPVRMESELWEVFGEKGYSLEEKEELVELFACCIYRYGVNDPLTMLLLGHVACATPRLASMAKKRRARKSGALADTTQGELPQPPASQVNGQAVAGSFHPPSVEMATQ